MRNVQNLHVENFKNLPRVTELVLSKQTSLFWMRKLIIKMSILPKLIYKFVTISNKNIHKHFLF